MHSLPHRALYSCFQFVVKSGKPIKLGTGVVRRELEFGCKNIFIPFPRNYTFM